MKIMLLLCVIALSFHGYAQIPILDDKSKSFEIGKDEKTCSVSVHFEALPLGKSFKFSVGYTERNPYAAHGKDFLFNDADGIAIQEVMMDVPINNRTAKFSLTVAGNFKGKKIICIDTYIKIDNRTIPNTLYVEVTGDLSNNEDKFSQTSGVDEAGTLEWVSLERIQVYKASIENKDHMINIEVPDVRDSDNTVTIRTSNLKINETYKGTVDFTSFLSDSNKLFLNGDPNTKLYVYARDVINYISPSSKSQTKRLSRETRSVPFTPSSNKPGNHP